MYTKKNRISFFFFAFRVKSVKNATICEKFLINRVRIQRLKTIKTSISDTDLFAIRYIFLTLIHLLLDMYFKHLIITQSFLNETF